MIFLMLYDLMDQLFSEFEAMAKGTNIKNIVLIFLRPVHQKIVLQGDLEGLLMFLSRIICRSKIRP